MSGLWERFKTWFADLVRDGNQQWRRDYEVDERLMHAVWAKKRIDNDGEAPDDVLDACMSHAWVNQGGFDCNDRA